MAKKEKVVPEEVAQDGAPAEKKRKKKWPIVLGTVVAVIAVAVVGFLVWHEQPSFCNAICHMPMDPYLPTYEATPGEASTDKWGNEVADASGMLAAVHRVAGEEAGSKITCMSCHVPTLSEQIGEGISWISGDYEVLANDTWGGVLQERDLETLVTARGLDSGDEFCLNPDCHDFTRSDLIQLTSKYTRNPHVAQHSTLTCDSCHKAHRASVNACSQCHSDAPIPDGWLTVAEEKKLESTAN